MEKETAVQALTALAQETRLDVYRFLVQVGRNGVSAGDIGRLFDLPPATLSFHLKELRNAGLVSCRREGRMLFYTADFGGMDALMQYLHANCCTGPDNACAGEAAMEKEGA